MKLTVNGGKMASEYVVRNPLATPYENKPKGNTTNEEADKPGDEAIHCRFVVGVVKLLWGHID